MSLTIDKSRQLLLSLKPSKCYLYRSDYSRFERFIRTAQPQETTRWSKYLMSYELTSQSIFLDAQAKPCRRYQLKVTPFLPIFKSVHCTEIACRGTDGQWKKEN
jgi:hypothetical protein